MSFAAEDSNGIAGFVISGHAAMDGDGIGGIVCQGGTRQIGEIADITGLFSDSSWVQADTYVVDVEPEIFYDEVNGVEDIRGVHDYYDPSLGSKVYKSGVKTNMTYGYVTDDYNTQSSETFGTLYYQFSADYVSDNGDSGAPVFKKYGNEVIIMGVHRGKWNGDAAFSPISGVILDLDITPLTT